MFYCNRVVLYNRQTKDTINETILIHNIWNITSIEKLSQKKQTWTDMVRTTMSSDEQTFPKFTHLQITINKHLQYYKHTFHT